MPDYDHFLTEDEFLNLNYAHRTLQGEDAEWLMRECTRVTNTMFDP